MRKRKSFFWQMVGGTILLVALAIFWPIKSDNTFNRLDISDKQNKLIIILSFAGLVVFFF